MPLPVSYMGTKRQLAAAVSEIVSSCRPGIFLDIFCGMGAVASVVGSARQIWTNDIQYFSHESSQAHFCSKTTPPTRFDTAALMSTFYSNHTKAHLSIASARLKEEESYISNRRAEDLNALYESWMLQKQLDRWVECRSDDATLFRDTFSGSYFGLSQAIEIDAIYYSIDKASSYDLIDQDQRRWLLLALCVAVSKCSTSTGHFAQPVRAKSTNIRWFAAQRRRSIRETYMSAVEGLKSIGDQEWRVRNRAIRAEANLCLEAIRTGADQQPAIIYADPPYTDDQYSRYYHIYETLIRYDYPEAIGRGRYRQDREVSTFSLKATVLTAITNLIDKSALIGADLVLSYPTHGLLKNSRAVIPELIYNAYGRKPEIKEINHLHSTMGGSKGEGKQAVTEVIYKARH